MRGVVHRVDPGERARLVRELGDPCHVHERPDCIGGPGIGNDPRALRELGGQVVEIERRVVADVREPDDEIEVARKLEPGRDVAVVVEARHEDLVAGGELPADRSREREVDRRHVRAEDDLLRAAPEKGAAGAPGLVDEHLGPPARLVGAADVRVRLTEVARDCFNDRVRYLGPARPVEEREGPVERREAATDGRDVEGDGAHGETVSEGTLSSGWINAKLEDETWGRVRGRDMEAAAVPAADVAERAPAAVVAAKDLTRRYGEGDTAVDALRGVSLEVQQGKLTAVMGPSGSGKSTLMHILAALDKPTSGSVWIAGTELGGLNDTETTKLRRQHIGFVFQFFNLLPMLTAEENIVLPLTIAGEKPDKEWREELLKTVGLDDRRGHRPSELSGDSSSASRLPAP